MTNADKIRSMGDVELYELFRDIYNAGLVDEAIRFWAWLNKIDRRNKRCK